MSTRRTVLLLAALSLVAAFAPSLRSETGDWIIEVVDPVDCDAWATPMVLDRDDHPHIAYVTSSNSPLDGLRGYLKCATFDGSTWRLETADARGFSGKCAAMDLDPRNGTPVISYQTFSQTAPYYGLGVARREGTAWSVTTTPLGNSNIQWTDIACDAEGHHHITYNGSSLFYRSYGAAGYETTAITNATTYAPDIAVDSHGHARFAFDCSPAKLGFASHDGTSWAVTRDLSSGLIAIGGWPSLAVDTENRAHIAFRQFLHNGAIVKGLAYARQDDTNWTFELVEAGMDVGGFCSIALTTRNYPCIAYADFATGDLKYAAYDGSRWTTELVATNVLGTSAPFRLALDSTDRPHIAYRNNATRKLCYAHVPFRISAEFKAVPAMGPAPLPVQFECLIPAGIRSFFWDFGDGETSRQKHPLHIYAENGTYDVTLTVSNETMVATSSQAGCVQAQERLGQGWYVEVIEEHAGGHPSLAIDAEDRLHVAYTHGYDTGNETLKYARTEGTNWITETVDAAADCYPAVELEVLTNGFARILYKDRRWSRDLLGYAAYDGVAWDRRTVTVSSLDGYAALALNPEERSAITSAPGGPGYGLLNGMSWSFLQVEPLRATAPGLLYSEDLAFTAGGRPWLCYSLWGVDLRFATRVFDGSQWVWDIRGTGAAAFGRPSVSVDAAGAPCAVYQTPAGLEYAALAYDGEQWRVSSRMPGPTGDSPRLCLTRSASPRVAFQDATDHAIMYATLDGGRWDTEIVYRSDRSTVAMRPSLVLDSMDNPHLAFFDRTHDGVWRIMHAWKYVQRPLQAAFSVDARQASPGLPVQFTDESLGLPAEYAWDFGDGHTSTNASPVHAYDAPGRYSVTLAVATLIESSTTTRVDCIEVAELAADFTLDDGSGPAPHTVQFMDRSTGTVDGRRWDFGDGAPTTDAVDPVHTYQQNGTYDVTLMVSNTLERAERTWQGCVNVSELGAMFDADITTGPVELTVTFTDRTFGTVTNRQWDFGDGSATSTEENPTHTYTSTGRFDVALSVWGPEGHDSHTAEGFIAAHDLAVAFSATPTTGPTNVAVFFTNASTGTWDTATWDFGELFSEPGTGDTPAHIYEQPGRYDVTLTLSNALATVSLTKSNLITVTDLDVTRTFPAYDEWAVPVSTNIRVTFSLPVSNVNERTFRVEAPYAELAIAGSYHQLDDTTWEFRPGSPLPEAEPILVTLSGGAAGITSDPSGATMDSDRHVRFRTQPRLTVDCIQAHTNEHERLVAGKPTMILVTVEGLADTNASVNVAVNVDGKPLASKLAVIKPAYSDLERKQGKDGVSFFLRSPHALDVPGPHDVTASVTPATYPKRTYAGQAACTTHAPKSTYGIEFLPIGLPPWSDGLSADEKQIYLRTTGVCGDLIRATWPVSATSLRIDVTETIPPEFAGLWENTFTLERLLIALHDRAKACSSIDRCIGVVPKGAIRTWFGFIDLGIGVSWGKGWFGVLIESGTADTDQKAAVAAHELMHTYGRYVGSDEDYTVNGPVGSFADGGWNVARRENGCIRNLYPVHGDTYEILYETLERTTTRLEWMFYTYMANTSPTEYWSTRADYKFLFGELFAPGDRQREARGSGETRLLLSGFMLDGGSVELSPIVSGDWLDPETPPSTNPTHAVAFYATTNLLKTYGFDVLALAGSAPTQAVFSFTVDMPSTADRLVITEGATVLTTIALNGHAPVPVLHAPAGGESLTGLVNVAWETYDPDDDAVTSSLYFSPDDGITWRLLALHLTGTNYAWDTRGYAGTTEGRLKLVATDGALTGSDTTPSPFSLATQPPSVIIASPEDGNTYTDETPVELRALLHDAAGGVPADDGIVWTSSLDGVLGTGASLTPPRLSYGEHTIGVSAVGEAGTTGTAQSVTIMVRPELVGGESGRGDPRDAIRWFARYGQDYRVVTTTDLTNGPWEECTTIVDADGKPVWRVAGREADVSVREADTARPGKRFYRIEALR